MRKVLLLFIALFMLGTSAKAGGFALYEASIRANGMLGAFSAYADHVSTIYYNPAGLSGLEGVHASAGATLIYPKTQFRGPLPYSREKTEMEDQSFALPNAFASYQIREGLTAGIGLYTPFGLGTKWPDDWVGRHEAVETELSTLFLNPAIGYTLPDFGIGRIQIGVGLQAAVYGDVILSRAITDFVPEGDFRLEGSLEEPGYGYNLGILYTPVDLLTFGFTYRSTVETKYSGDANFQNLPESGFPSGVNGHTTLDLPSSWVAALNIRPSENLTLEVDYLHWGWSSYDNLAIVFDEHIPAFEELPNYERDSQTLTRPRDYENTWQIRAGIEYRNLGLSGLTVRAGIAYDNSPIPDRTYDPTLPGADRTLYSAGASYSVSRQLSIDVSYIYIRFKERKNETSMTGFDGVYNTYTHLPGVGLSFKL